MRTKACIVRRNGVWSVKQPLPSGKYRWRTVGKRKRDAELLRDELNRRAALGMAYPVEPETFQTFSAAWLERYRAHVRPATFEVAERSLRHLAPFAGHLVEALTPAEVEDAIWLWHARRRERLSSPSTLSRWCYGVPVSEASASIMGSSTCVRRVANVQRCAFCRGPRSTCSRLRRSRLMRTSSRSLP